MSDRTRWLGWGLGPLIGLLALGVSASRPGPPAPPPAPPPGPPCDDLRVLDLRAERARLEEARAARVLLAATHQALLDEAAQACGLSRGAVLAECDAPPCVAVSFDPRWADLDGCAADPRVQRPVVATVVSVACPEGARRAWAAGHDLEGTAPEDLDPEWLAARALVLAGASCGGGAARPGSAAQGSSTPGG